MRLNKIVAQYVAFRKSLGDDFTSAESLLKTFCRFMDDDVELDEIPVEDVQAFLTGTRSLSSYWRRKYDTLRGLYRYAISRGFIDCSPLPLSAPRTPRFKPYIYTEDEVRRLLNGISNCLNPPRRLQPHTLRVILLLLYGAGLRIGEAVKLTVADVNVAESLVVIRDTKFHKSRICPLGPQLNKIITDYSKQRNAAGHSTSGDARFFVLRRGAPVSRLTAERAFRRLCRHVGVYRNDGARYQPRLHDMRHSFCVRRLTSWYQQGADVQKLLPQLATYLGHQKLAFTQVYLTMTPELLQHASVRFERYAFEEVCHG
jgi:site-specific recombinase XerD